MERLQWFGRVAWKVLAVRGSRLRRRGGTGRVVSLGRGVSRDAPTRQSSPSAPGRRSPPNRSAQEETDDRSWMWRGKGYWLRKAAEARRARGETGLRPWWHYAAPAALERGLMALHAQGET